MDFVAILKELFSGVLYLASGAGLKTLAMFVIAGVLIYLAIRKDYEPALLLPSLVSSPPSWYLWC